MDYPRFFATAETAQILAYQSAHSISSTSSPVRTIAMPQQSAARTGTSTSPSSSSTLFGFSVAGALFWVRRIPVLVVGSYSSPDNQYEAYAWCCRTNTNARGSQFNGSHSSGCDGCWIVGTDRHAATRRVTNVEVDDPQRVGVFVGSGAATAASAAMARMPLDAPVEVRRLPIGPAPVVGWWEAWPVFPHHHPHPYRHTANTSTNTNSNKMNTGDVTMECCNNGDDDHHAKRLTTHYSGGGHNNDNDMDVQEEQLPRRTHLTEWNATMMMATDRPSKRHCISTDNTAAATAVPTFMSLG